VSTGNEPPAAGGPNPNPYLALIDAIQASQEKTERALREMVENREANLSIIRAMQTADTNAVALFEKALQVMKRDSLTVPVSNTTPAKSQATLPAPKMPRTTATEVDQPR
jgi:hypothetical protein